MHIHLRTLRRRLQNLTRTEDGQDLIEYALVIALIAFAATAGMGSVATSVNAAFVTVGSTLTANL